MKLIYYKVPLNLNNIKKKLYLLKFTNSKKKRSKINITVAQPRTYSFDWSVLKKLKKVPHSKTKHASWRAQAVP